MTPENLALKRATSEMVKGVGGVEAGAGFCRVGKSQLADYGNVSRADSFVPVDVIADLEPLARDRAGWPHVTQALCQRMGGVFVALPEVPVTSGRLLELMSALSAEFNDATGTICRGLADGDFCAVDAGQLERDLADVIRVSISMQALARSIKGGER